MQVCARVLFYGALWLFVMRLLGPDDPHMTYTPLALPEATVWLGVFAASSLLVARFSKYEMEKCIMGWTSFTLIFITLGLWWAKLDWEFYTKWSLFSFLVLGTAWVCTHPEPHDHHHHPR